MASELFEDEPGVGGSTSDSAPLTTGNSKRAKGNTALAEAPKTAESSSEPGGAVPMMPSPTTDTKYGEPLLPERIADAPVGQGSIFAGDGLPFARYFTKSGEDVFDTTEWDYRAAIISGEGGAVVFEQKDVEIPKSWSMLATNVVVSKYFRGKVGTPGRENSVKQLVSRVADTIYNWGKQGNYFATDEDADVFHAELKYLLLHQYMAFNSPVWFNLGVPGERPQVSACQPYYALVSTPQGLIPIGKLVEDNAVGTTIYDANGTTRIVATKANGVKNVLRVHTKAGYKLDVTADHLVWKKTSGGSKKSGYPRGKFVEAGTLESGDQLMWHRTPLTGKADQEGTEEAEAALAGWLQSDGFVGQYETGTNRSLTIEALVVNADEEAWVRSAIAQVFPDVHTKTRDFITLDETLQGKRIRLYGESLRPFVEKWGLLTRGTEMTVPERLYTAPYSVAAAYLRSLFQAEGYVILRDNAALAMDMIAGDLIHGVQKLMLRFGIYSRVRFKADARTDRKGCYTVRVQTLGDRKRWAQEIGFIGTAKQEKLIAGLDRKGLELAAFKRMEIDRIEDLGAMEVYDIQTESGEYLSGNLRVHNCFINSVEDTMESILTLAKTEGMLFKWGSGTGTNVSVLRSSQESLKGGGTASGPVSFMRGFDAFAGAIKSGGKCFKKGTLVATPEGWLPIEALNIGDLVNTHKGPRPVADFMENGVKQCFRVQTEEGYSVEVTVGHKFAFWNTLAGGFDVKPIEEFRVGEAMYVLTEPSEGGNTIPLITPEVTQTPNATTTIEMSFPNVLCDKFAYVLGLMYGDGELRTEYPHRVRVSFCKDAAGYASAERFTTYCQELFGGAPLMLTDKSGFFVLGYTRKRLIEFLSANNIAKGKADNLRFPVALFSAPPEVRAAFIAGFIDADGTYQARGGWSISGIDRAFLEQLQRLILTLGVPSKLRVSRTARDKWQTLYRLHIMGHTFSERLVNRIVPYSAKAMHNYIASPGADKGWGYRPSLLPALAARVEKRGGYHLIERRVGMNDTTGYGALVSVAATHPHASVAAYAAELSRCVQVTLESVTPTEMAETYDIEVEGVHLLCSNGLYASNTRRAAKMVILNSDHPDIEEFIECKADAEKKAHALIEAGFSGAFNVPNGAYDSVFFQNANHSVRGTDDFMRAVELDREWSTREVLTGNVAKTFRARDLMRKIAEATWVCGDPGMQFDTTANRWHTCPNTDRINASNPCSEFFFLDDTACNLASLNLMKFRTANREFDVEMFRHAVRITSTAMEIMVGNAAYPTDKITINSHDYRPLGLGYANLGALLMARGLAYDSDEGRAYAAAITAILSGEGYTQSAKIARRVGPFAGYEKNKQPMTRVMQMHRDHVEAIAKQYVPDDMIAAARKTWDNCLDEGAKYGYRNSQISVLAPTGTIGFMMDCDTTGVEPDIAIVKFKSLVGGGFFKIVNQTVPEALERLGYSASERKAILEYIEEQDTIEGAPGLSDDHLSIFDCAFRAKNGVRSIHYMGHIKMMSAVQPFISGAISKTCNLPHEANPDDIAEAYLEAWKLGVKAIAIYRDGSKKTQPLSTGKAETPTAKQAEVAKVEFKPFRRKLPDERAALTHKFSVGGHEGYITIGTYPDGQVGEIFVTMSKEGSVVSGLMDSFATAISLSLQYGVPLKTLVDKFMHTRFEPSGFTGNPDIPMAKSIMDYLFRYLALKFLDKDERANVGLIADQDDDEYGETSATEQPKASLGSGPVKLATAKLVRTGTPGQQGPVGAPAPASENRAGAAERQVFVTQADAPPCPECGSITTRNGACYRCANCGTSIGCS